MLGEFDLDPQLKRLTDVIVASDEGDARQSVGWALLRNDRRWLEWLKRGVGQVRKNRESRGG